MPDPATAMSPSSRRRAWWRSLEPFGFGIASFNNDLHVLYREIPDFARHFLIPLDQYAVDPYTTTVLA